MGRYSRAVGDAAIQTAAFGLVQGVAVAMSGWWLLPPVMAAYHFVALILLVFGGVSVAVLIMVAEAILMLIAAFHGRSNGRRDWALADAAMTWGAEQPALFGQITGPAGGHRVSLALAAMVAPLQAAAYITAYRQAAAGITAADLRRVATGPRPDRPTAAGPVATPAPPAPATLRVTAPAPVATRPAGAFLGWADRGGAVRANPRGACLVIGPPGRGKTDGVINPTVATAPGPVVSTSIKWDVLTGTFDRRRAVGTVWAYDPGGDETALPAGVVPVHWSPLDSVYDWESALTVASRLRQALPDADDPRAAHWLDRARDWAAVLLYAASFRGPDDLMRWTRRPRGSTDDVRATLESNPGVDTDMAADTLAAVVDDTEAKERSAIESTLARFWAVYKLPGAVRVARDTNFSPAAFVRSSADSLYIAVPAARTDVYTPAVVALLEAIRFEQYRLYEEQERTGETGCRTMTFVLDEAANTAPVDVPAIASEAGGQRLHLVVALQDLSQARHRWGDERGGGLLTVMGTKAVLRGIIDRQTLDGLSAAAGDYQRKDISQHIGPDGRPSTSYSHTREPVMPPSRISRLADNRVIVIDGGDPREIAAASWWQQAPRIVSAP